MHTFFRDEYRELPVNQSDPSTPESIPNTQLNRFLGANPVGKSKVRFCVWSPTCKSVSVEIQEKGIRQLLTKVSGYHVVEIDGAAVGDKYFYRFDDGPLRPDPASRFQPDGVHGASQVVSREFDWTDSQWETPCRDELIIYELHVGTYTNEGTYDGAIGRLPELVDLGITAIELMPLADCAGRWNWGYDGVNLFAPNRNYGKPDDLRRFVDSAHQLGLAVLLDVVYNHLGPEGNYLGESGPYLSQQHSTAWGSAPNFDHPVHGIELRRFFIANVIHWFDDYHIDGLRVDAVHCMKDTSPRHVIADMSHAARAWSGENDRSVILVAETNVYDPQMIAPPTPNRTSDQDIGHDEIGFSGIGFSGIGFDAQWCDDFLHSVFAVLRPGEQLCHRSYKSGKDLDQTLKLGYVFEGTLQEDLGRPRVDRRVDTRGLIYSIQHHDFIGNHPLGKRLHQLTSLETQRAAAALLILSPAIPMFFMGEEFACDRPFQFFVDFDDEALRQSVVEGRRREYPQHDWSSGTLPIDQAAFDESKIGNAVDGSPEMRKWYKELISLRKQYRGLGVLADEHLTAETIPENGFYSLRYGAGNVELMVAVRLVAPEDDSVFQHELASDFSQVLLDSRSENSDFKIFRGNHAKVFTK